MIKAVLFDFGGVLTESGKQGFIGQIISELYHVPLESVRLADLHGQLRRGKINARTFFEELDKRYGGPISVEMFLDKVHALFVPAPAVYELAKQLRRHNIKTGILSNIFEINAQKLRAQGWYDDFDPLLLSYEVGYAKPDQEFYQLALERLGLPPDEILLIDDQEKCMPPARELGMHTLLATSPEQIVADTRALIRGLNGIELGA